MKTVMIAMGAVAALLVVNQYCSGGCPGNACAAKPADTKAEAPKAEELGHVDVTALKALVASKADLTLVDARSEKYDDGKRIPGAIHITPDATVDVIGKALPTKDKLVVVYCSNTQCPASAILGKRLKEAGYKNVLKLPEGIAGWTEAGNAVDTVTK